MKDMNYLKDIDCFVSDGAEYNDFVRHELQRTARAAGPAFKELWHAESIKRFPNGITAETLEALVVALDELAGGDEYD